MTKEEKLTALATLYAEEMIYPLECYKNSSIVRIFQRRYPKNYYSQDIEVLLKNQKYIRVQRGADLPWWGSKYFDEKHKRIMIISNDSLSPDAGSIVFYACLMQIIDEYQYRDFIRDYNLPKFISWKKSKDLLSRISSLDNMFITDASKVYRRGSWNDRDFDHEKSRLLLKREIEICNPNLVILLGEQPLKVLEFKQKYANVVGSEILSAESKKFIVAPFPSNANARNYEERAYNTEKLVKSILGNGV
ncbi:MAG: hypothetical protein APF76_14990 [Desulfitibacter sp. BRH_c19]|nr:MAG: hypothetical protein APF76_14990 [Desulfitibacter sp. BRH_c19]